MWNRGPQGSDQGGGARFVCDIFNVFMLKLWNDVIIRFWGCSLIQRTTILMAIKCKDWLIIRKKTTRVTNDQIFEYKILETIQHDKF